MVLGSDTEGMAILWSHVCGTMHFSQVRGKTWAYIFTMARLCLAGLIDYFYCIRFWFDYEFGLIDYFVIFCFSFSISFLFRLSSMKGFCRYDGNQCLCASTGKGCFRAVLYTSLKSLQGVWRRVDNLKCLECCIFTKIPHRFVLV